jgi:hypothetical protein
LALKDLNWQYLWDLTKQQFAYPPLGSFLIALLNLPFGFSLTTARFVSAFGFVLGGILVYKLNLSAGLSALVRRQEVLGGMLALFLYLTSPAILFYSTVVLKESTGMALTLLFLYLYFRAVSQKKILPYLWVGISLVLLFFEKYNYAGLLAITLGLEAIVEFVVFGSHSEKRRKFFLSQVAIFSPLIITSGFWILMPVNKLQWFLDIMRSDWNPVTVGLGTRLEYFLYYIQSIRVSYLFSDILFLMVFISYFLAIKDLGLKKIRFLFVFFTLNFILATSHSINLQDRYIYTSVPALFLIAGYEWKYIILKLTGLFKAGLQSSHRHIYLALCLVILALSTKLIIDFLHLSSYVKSNATHMLSSPMYNESDYRDTIFNFNKNDWPKGHQKTKAKSESPEEVIDYILDATDITKSLEIVGFTAEISPDWVELRKAIRKSNRNYSRNNNDKNHNRYLAAIEIKETSRLYTYDYRRANSWQLTKVKEFEGFYKDNLLEKKEFKELGVVVFVYGF